MKRFLLAGMLLVSVAVNAADMSLPIRGVADGDTVVSALDLPCPLCKVSVRIRGIDTPESNHLAKCRAEQLKGIEAKTFLKTYLHGKTVMTARDIKWDKYGGRIDATVEVDGVDIGNLMIEKGYAKPYPGVGPKPDWCS